MAGTLVTRIAEGFIRITQLLKQVQTDLNGKIDGINQQIPNLATLSYVQAALTPKASIVYVDTILATKAEQTDLEQLTDIVSEKVDQADLKQVLDTIHVEIEALPPSFKIIDFNPDDYIDGDVISFNPTAYSLLSGNNLSVNPDNKQYLYPSQGLNPDTGIGISSAGAIGHITSGKLTLSASSNFVGGQAKYVAVLPSDIDIADFLSNAFAGQLNAHPYLFIVLSAFEYEGMHYNGSILYQNMGEPVQAGFECSDDFIELVSRDGLLDIYFNTAGVKTLQSSHLLGDLNSVHIGKLCIDGQSSKLELFGDMPFTSTLSGGVFSFPDGLEDGTYLRLTKPYKLLGYDLLTGDVLQVYDNHTKGLVIRQDNYFEYLKLLLNDSDLINAIQDQITELENEIGSRPTTTQINTIIEALVTNAEFTTAINQKADKSELYNKLDVNTFNGYTTQTNSTLFQLQNDKANRSELNSLQGTVTQLSSNQAYKADLVNGVVPAAQLPSYVDDVLEYGSWTSFPQTGENSKIYIDTVTNKAYRWAGSGYTVISDTISLGETSSTAYRGDRGKIAYDHSQSSGNPHNTQIADVFNLQYQLNQRVSTTDTTYQAIQTNYIDKNAQYAGLGFPAPIQANGYDITLPSTPIASKLKFDSGFGVVSDASNAPSNGTYWYIRNGWENTNRKYGFEMFISDSAVLTGNSYSKSAVIRISDNSGNTSLGRIYKSDDPVIYNTTLDTLDNLVAVNANGELKRSTVPSQQWGTRLQVWGGDSSATGAIGGADTLSNALWKLQNSKEPAIASGTASQYWRGDKTWQTLGNAASLNTGTSSGAVLTAGTYGLGLPISISTAWNTDGNLTGLATVDGGNYLISAGSVAALGYGMGMMRRVDATRIYGFTVSTNGNNGRMFYFDLTYDSNTSTWVKTVWEQYGTGNTIKDANGFIKASNSSVGDAVIVNQLTKAQYDALTTTEKNSTTKLYVIVG